MTNMKEEFLEEVKGKEVLCVDLKYGCDWVDPDDDERPVVIQLVAAYSQEEYDKFLEKINFEYDNGFGLQLLSGIIWYKDGTWSERGEYDGSEWWEYKSRPKFPRYLLP